MFNNAGKRKVTVKFLGTDLVEDGQGEGITVIHDGRADHEGSERDASAKLRWSTVCSSSGSRPWPPRSR